MSFLATIFVWIRRNLENRLKNLYLFCWMEMFFPQMVLKFLMILEMPT